MKQQKPWPPFSTPPNDYLVDSTKGTLVAWLLQVGTLTSSVDGLYTSCVWTILVAYQPFVWAIHSIGRETGAGWLMESITGHIFSSFPGKKATESQAKTGFLEGKGQSPHMAAEFHLLSILYILGPDHLGMGHQELDRRF